MQTFMPYASMHDSVWCLDTRRLGNQRNEARILHTAITEGNGWSCHPAARMWRSHADALAMYYNHVLWCWEDRGHRNTMAELPHSNAVILPWWIGHAPLHISHRSNLTRKLPAHYGPLWPDIPDNIPYVWPEPQTVA